jgi:hypothetical protein
MLVPAQSISAVATVTAMLTLTSPDGKAKVEKPAVALKKPSIKKQILVKGNNAVAQLSSA